MYATVAVLSLGVVGNALVLGGEATAAGGVVSAAAVLELVAMVALMLNDLECATAVRLRSMHRATVIETKALTNVDKNFSSRRIKISESSQLATLAFPSMVEIESVESRRNQIVHLEKLVRTICRHRATFPQNKISLQIKEAFLP